MVTFIFKTLNYFLDFVAETYITLRNTEIHSGFGLTAACIMFYMCSTKGSTSFYFHSAESVTSACHDCGLIYRLTRKPSTCR